MNGVCVPPCLLQVRNHDNLEKRLQEVDSRERQVKQWEVEAEALLRANRQEAQHLAEQQKTLEEKRQEWQDELEVGDTRPVFAVAGPSYEHV